MARREDEIRDRKVKEKQKKITSQHEAKREAKIKRGEDALVLAGHV